MKSAALDLLVLSTERQVHAFDLTRHDRIRIGRHGTNELQLSSRTVSNFHAEILHENGELVLRDLGSTNGTYLNGERVEQERLSTGDRILMGNHQLRLDLRSRSEAAGNAPSMGDVETWEPGRRGRILSPYWIGPDLLKTVQVRHPDDICLVDLIRGLAASPGSLSAVIEHDSARATIHFHQHYMIHAEYGATVGEKALYRIFRWQEPSYVVEPLTRPESLPHTIALPVEMLINEGTEQALELGKLVARLPPLAAPLRLNPDCPVPLTRHTPAEIEIFQAIIREETIDRVLEASPFTDVRVLRLVESLLRKGVFEVSRAASFDSTMEETFHSNLSARPR